MQQTGGQFPIANRIIDSSFTVKDSFNTNALYVYNYRDSGFVVLSAELKHQPIYAYVPNGKVLQYDSVPGALVEWFGKTVENIELLRTGAYDDGNRGARA
jgi:hypothetical protein